MYGMGDEIAGYAAEIREYKKVLTFVKKYLNIDKLDPFTRDMLLDKINGLLGENKG